MFLDPDLEQVFIEAEPQMVVKKKSLWTIAAKVRN